MAKHSKTQHAQAEKNPLDEKLEEILHNLRLSGKRVNLAEVLAIAKGEGITPSWEAIHALGARIETFSLFVVPPFITRFLAGYLGERGLFHILDPCAGVGSLLLPLQEMTSTTRATGIVRSQDECEIARLMDKEARVNWVVGQPRILLDDLPSFHAVVSAPYLGLRDVAETFTTEEGTVTVKDTETYVLALKAALHIREDGEAIFLFPNGFFSGGGVSPVREALPKLGLYVNTVVALPADTFSPYTSIEFNLVVISRRATPNLFVARLNPDQDATALRANLMKRVQGPVPELGRLVEPSAYRGWSTLVSVEEEQRLAKQSGLTPTPLRDLVLAVNLADRRKDEAEAFRDTPNSVYLPLIGNSPAVSALSDLRIKPHNYAQLVINTDKAYAGFIAEFFNSALGRKTRDKLLSGTYIPKITKQNLLESAVYTLPLDGQKKAMDVTRGIRELRLSLEQLESTLWRRPVDAGRVERDLAKLNEKEGFENWIETIPFPLASILWRYKATVDTRSKNEHLLHFFEATAMFLATLMTSAFHSDSSFFEEHKLEWFDAGKDRQYSLAKSSFGQWIKRCYALAKTTRTQLNGKDTRDLCLRMFRTNDDTKLAKLASRTLYSTLEKAGGYRNLQAHGGLTSEQNEARKLALLEKELTETRVLLGSLFEDWWVVRPGANTYTRGVYYYTAEKLTGSRQVFTQEKLQTTTAMDSEELYLFDTGARQPLQLLHFFKMMPSPRKAQIACYFYNRVEKDEVKWVSYHFEEDDDVLLPDPSVLKLIQEVEDGGR